MGGLVTGYPLIDWNDYAKAYIIALLTAIKKILSLVVVVLTCSQSLVLILKNNLLMFYVHGNRVQNQNDVEKAIVQL